MLISSAPIVIPVNTANLPTESVAAEAAQRPRIPQPTSATESTSSKNSTEFSDQAKNALENSLQAEQDKIVSEKEDSEQATDQQESEQQKQSDTAENRVDEELEADELRQVQKLQNRDREVRAHEQAHAAVGGNLAGAPNLSFTTGPDGKRYAISGDVSIDISKVANDPAATIRKLEQVQRAALAPANPSSQDLKVAAQASASANQARGELNVQKLNESQEADEEKAARTEANRQQSDSLSSSEPGKVDLKETESAQVESFNSPSNVINPVTARRQATQLNNQIVNSGALEVAGHGDLLSLIA